MAVENLRRWNFARSWRRKVKRGTNPGGEWEKCDFGTMQWRTKKKKRRKKRGVNQGPNGAIRRESEMEKC